MEDTAILNGHIKLWLAIHGVKVKSFYKKQEKKCRICSIPIEKSIPKIGRMCRNCYLQWHNDRMKQYYLKHPDRIKKYNKQYAIDNPLKVRAWWRAQDLYPQARMCQVEGCGELAQKHHDDYSSDTVKFLCPVHHKQLHIGQ